MTTPGQALAVSNAAAAEAGSSSADSTTVSCQMVRVGMFFDGTGNSRAHVGTDHIDSWHSNVDLLERVYLSGNVPASFNVEGRAMRASFGKIYIRGVGVEAGGGSLQWGLPYGTAWGIGSEGVASRTTEGLDAARQEIRTLAGGQTPCVVWLDTFGFSRGACVSRNFANKVKDGAIRVGGRNALVKFMGLWDTVSSIGEPGNTGGWPDEGVRIGTTGTAQDIVHITAKDELRENFPLTLARRGKRIAMVGSHSDIGGGYAPGINSGSVGYSAGREDAFFETVAAKWGLSLGEWQRSFTMRWRESSRVHGDRLSEMMTSAGMAHSWTKSFSWEAIHGLQFVALRLMHDEAVAKNVPLEPLGNAIDGIAVGLRPELRTYYNEIKSASHSNISDSAT